jgi:hypothetical protein
MCPSASPWYICGVVCRCSDDAPNGKNLFVHFSLYIIVPWTRTQPLLAELVVLATSTPAVKKGRRSGVHRLLLGRWMSSGNLPDGMGWRERWRMWEEGGEMWPTMASSEQKRDRQREKSSVGGRREERGALYGCHMDPDCRQKQTDQSRGFVLLTLNQD